MNINSLKTTNGKVTKADQSTQLLFKTSSGRGNRSGQNSDLDDDGDDEAIQSENNNSSGGGFGGIWKGLKRFLPQITQAKINKSFEVEKTDNGNRYHLRLVEPDLQQRRHVITRIRRYCEDISWEQAEEIFDQAAEEGRAIIQIMNSVVSVINLC